MATEAKTVLPPFQPRFGAGGRPRKSTPGPAEHVLGKSEKDSKGWSKQRRCTLCWAAEHRVLNKVTTRCLQCDVPLCEDHFTEWDHKRNQPSSPKVNV